MLASAASSISRSGAVTDEFDIEVGRRPQIEAPTVAALMQEMNTRPAWAAEQPFEVDADTYTQAKREMTEIQRRQGRTVSAAPWVGRPNFLLRGVPVVVRDLGNAG